MLPQAYSRIHGRALRCHTKPRNRYRIIAFILLHIFILDWQVGHGKNIIVPIQSKVGSYLFVSGLKESPSVATLIASCSGSISNSELGKFSATFSGILSFVPLPLE